jgi:hypothetical protein
LRTRAASSVGSASRPFAMVARPGGVGRGIANLAVDG